MSSGSLPPNSGPASPPAPRELRYEWLTSHAVKTALAAEPLAFLPIGCLEKHGDHLPMGLDPIKAHLICCAAARALGGLVFPPHFYAGVHRLKNTPTGEAHARNWGDLYTYDTAELQLVEIIGQIAKIGVRTLVLFSGHHPRTQMAMLQRLSSRFADSAAQGLTPDPIRVIPGDERTLLGEGDHAGIWETSLMLALDPTLVNMTAISDLNRVEHNWTDATDARLATLEIGAARLARIIDLLRVAIATA